MAKITNLTRARKDRDRMKDRQQADENAAKFGMTKSERVLIASRDEKARKHLDAHRATPDDEFEQDE